MTVGAINVLVVDDEPHICHLIEGVLASDEFRCVSAHSGREAMRLLSDGKFDVVVLDLLMPDVSGMELLKFISIRGLPTRAVCITGVSAGHTSKEALDAGAFDFFEKPFDVFHLVESVRCAAESRRDVVGGKDRMAPSGQYPANKREEFHVQPAWVGGDEQLKQSLLESIGALVRAVEAKDPYTRRHSDHVAYYAEQFARLVGVSENIVESIRVAALLHDIGKIAVPDSVLIKPSKLSRREFALIRRHPDVGAAILRNITMLRVEARLVRHHHENWDGSGYPAGLSAKKIPLGSRILNISDSIDAMLMHRTYKQAYPVDRMLEELDCCSGKQFAPDLARQAIDWCQNNPSKLILPEKMPQSKTA
ncbi:MAG: response regulator [Planctomycetota bacterium]|nr:response regulator [Planctomycetota bacterium]